MVAVLWVPEAVDILPYKGKIEHVNSHMHS